MSYGTIVLEIGDGAARLTGDDHFEEAGRCCEIAEQRVFWIGRERSGERQMFEDGEDIFFRGR